MKTLQNFFDHLFRLIFNFIWIGERGYYEWEFTIDPYVTSCKEPLVSLSFIPFGDGEIPGSLINGFDLVLNQVEHRSYELNIIRDGMVDHFTMLEAFKKYRLVIRYERPLSPNIKYEITIHRGHAYAPESMSGMMYSDSKFGYLIKQ